MGPATQSSYVTALRFPFLTRFYDCVLAATIKEEKFKQLLVEQSSIQPGHRVLDVGCGTATLTLMLARHAPQAEVFGLDGDADALAIARKKIADAGAQVTLVQALAFEAPFEAGSFDRIVSSLVFHHLTREQKKQTLDKCRELLSKGGELHIADWGRAQNLLMRTAFLGVQLLDGFETTTDNVRGVLPRLIEQAGFESVQETRREATIFGTLSLYRAVAP